ncbi:MAG: tetratricopeptide repeat protein [Pseudomonadota bacterium]|nr:tetratricopeptide repeat protein [Pseudomonadota bacterium]
MTDPVGRRLATPAEVVGAARWLRREGRLSEAEQAYRHAASVAPDNVAIWLELGGLCLQQERAGAAEAALRRAIEVDPGSAEARNVLGRVLAARNRPFEALAQYEQAVALEPSHAAARNNLGATLLALGRAEEARVQFECAIDLAPDWAAIHNNLGNALAALQRYAEALAPYGRALELAPDFAEAHYNMGMALAQLQRPDEAVARFRRAVELHPAYLKARVGLGWALGLRERWAEAINQLEQVLASGHVTADLLNDLGSYLASEGRREEAAARFREACAMRPDFAAAHNNLGNALVKLHEPAQAVASYQRALALEPDFAPAWSNLGAALAALARPEDSLTCFERALAIDPHFAEAYRNRGYAFIALGHMADAREAFIRAIALEPARPDSYRGLTLCGPLDKDDPHFSAMEALAADLSSKGDQDAIELRFALARAYEEHGEFDKAFAHLSGANAGRRLRSGYDENKALGLLRRVRQEFTPERMRRVVASRDPPDAPIFILGMPRSGSTLVEQILASHPDVFGGGERLYLADEAANLRDASGAVMTFPESLRTLEAEELTALGARYRQRLRALAPTAPRITDKMPGNFLFAGLIALALPRARVIHTRRDPADTCLSCFAQNFTAGQLFSNDLGELGRYYRGYAELMAHWRETLPENFMLEVRYEELVNGFEPGARRILDYCGLAWDERCLAFHRNRRPILTASAAQVRRPLYQSSAGRSRAYGTLLQPLFDALGDLLPG